MSSFVQHFSDGSVWGCIDDYFRHHEYGYIKLKDVNEWYNMGSDKEWKKRVINEYDFHEAVKGLERVHPEPKAPEKKEKEKTNHSVEEVEEKPEETRGNFTAHDSSVGYNRTLQEDRPLFKDHSILEKLREELEKNMKSCKNSTDAHVIGRYWQAKETLDLLTSLEKEPDKPMGEEVKEPIKEKLEKLGIDKLPTFPSPKLYKEIKDSAWTPTPGEMIEVSDDCEKWEKRKFVGTRNTKGPFIYITKGDGFFSNWIHARPIKESPELPSKRIRELHAKFLGEPIDPDTPEEERMPIIVSFIPAIIQYLDEQALSRKK